MRFDGIPLMNDHLNQVGFCDPALSPLPPLGNINAMFEDQFAMGPSMEADTLKKHDSFKTRHDDFLIEVAPEIESRLKTHDPTVYHL